MSIINRLLNFNKDKNTAAKAKERLQIIISHERSNRNGPDYLPEMRQDLLTVIRKYIEIDDEQIKVDLAEEDGCAILELNVTLPQEA